MGIRLGPKGGRGVKKKGEVGKERVLSSVDRRDSRGESSITRVNSDSQGGEEGYEGNIKK